MSKTLFRFDPRFSGRILFLLFAVSSAAVALIALPVLPNQGLSEVPVVVWPFLFVGAVNFLLGVNAHRMLPPRMPVAAVEWSLIASVLVTGLGAAFATGAALFFFPFCGLAISALIPLAPR